MNLIAIIYWISVWRIVSLNFKPNVFKKDKGTLLNPTSCTKYNLKAQFGTFKNQQMITLLKLHLFMLSLFIIWQMSFSVYTNIQFNRQHVLLKGISDFFCPEARRDDTDQYDEDGQIFQQAAHIDLSHGVNK
jgi:hypothetical protein